MIELIKIALCYIYKNCGRSQMWYKEIDSDIIYDVVTSKLKISKMIS